MSYVHIQERLRNGEIVLLDGGVGTEIVRRGARWRNNALATNPDIVRSVYEDYIAAGADVIRTNTFQLSRRTFLNLFRDLEHLRRIGAPNLEHRAGELIRLAVNLARQARDRSGRAEVAIAGVLSPLNHPFRPDLAPPAEEARAEHAETVRHLSEAGVDFILLESMNTIVEAKAALQAADGFPTWVSFVCDEQGRLLNGESLAEAVREIEPLQPEAVLVNCAPPMDIGKALEVLRTHCSLPIGAYAHIGRYNPPSWKFEFFPSFVDTDEFPPEKYAQVVQQWVAAGARIVGGCCGTTPEHIRFLRTMIKTAEHTENAEKR